MTWMHAGKAQGFNYMPLSHDLAQEHGINTSFIKNQRIQIGYLRDLPNLDNAIWSNLPCQM